jgi:1-pyrroline-5-carboxylate dehydrogenase
MPLGTPPLFVNEPYADFTQSSNRTAMEKALADVRARLGGDNYLLIDGERRAAAERFTSTNPSKPGEVIGIHAVATAEEARQAVDAAHAFFPEWAATSFEYRVNLLLGASERLKRRKYEFNAWLVLEAGKSWAEAEAETCEAIDFCEYYARHALLLASPEPTVQLPGETAAMRYLPLGAGVIIAPWNFPLAILAGMTVAALVTGNTVVIKPSSDTPTVAAEFVELLLEAGFPPRAIQFITGPGGALGDALVGHPKTRFVSFTGSRDVGLHINELAAKPAPGQIWIKRVVAEMGGKDAIIVDSEADLEAAAKAVVASAFGYQGQKCSACSRAIVDEKIYDQFVDRIATLTAAIPVGAAEDVENLMGPVINAKAKKTILGYIEKGIQEGRLVTGGAASEGDGFFIKPTIIADVAPTATIFREEIFGPVLAVSKARDFEHALQLANDTEYGLTGAVFTTNHKKIDAAIARFFVGNLYINRKCTGAMVGAHPFGGFNMSGTDSKAGGPDYLLQFVQAQSIAERVLD